MAFVPTVMADSPPTVQRASEIVERLGVPTKITQAPSTQYLVRYLVTVFMPVVILQSTFPTMMPTRCIHSTAGRAGIFKFLRVPLHFHDVS